MLKTVEGVCRDGRVDLSEVPEGVEGARVLVTFLGNGAATENAEVEPEDEEPVRDRHWYREHAAEIAARIREQAAKTGPLPPGISPSGLPERMPTDEEWAERAARISATLRRWAAEPPSDDLATPEEIAEGLRKHPFQLRGWSSDE